MRRIGMLTALSLLLAWVAPAQAKEVTSVRLCGPTDCVSTKEPDVLDALHEGGAPTDPPAQGSSWYRARLTVSAEGARDYFTLVVVPAARLIRPVELQGGNYMWMPISASAAKTIGAATAGLAPFRAAKLAGTGPVRKEEVATRPLPLPSDDEGDEDGVSLAWVGGSSAALLAAGGLLIAFRRRRLG